MDTRKLVASVVIVLLVCGLAWPVMAAGESESRYAELLQIKSHTMSLRSLGMAILAMPYEGDNLVPQMIEQAWFNHPDAEMDEADRELAASYLRDQLETVANVVAKYNIRELSLIGISFVGSLNNVDYYFAADTAHGPVIFRTTGYFDPNAAPRLFAFKVFEGWEECREIMSSIEHRPGKGKMFSVNYTPQEAPTGDSLPAADES